METCQNGKINLVVKFIMLIFAVSKTTFMGYTHYWDIKKKSTAETRKNFASAVEEIKKIYASLPRTTQSAGGYYPRHKVVIKNGMGVGNPTFNDHLINFNGNAKNGTDHEGFHIDLNGRNEWNFCKTARKPYDLLVCCSLIALANNSTTELFKFSSDGTLADWKQAIALYTSVTGREVPQRILNWIKK